MDTMSIVAAFAALGAGVGAGFFIGKRKVIASVQRALTAKLAGDRNSGVGDGPEIADVLAVVDKISAARNEELVQKLAAARADIADLASVSLEQKLVRRIDDDVQALKNIKGVLDKAVHRICDEMREDIKGCIAYQVLQDEPQVVTTYGIDEQGLQAASTKALLSMLPTIVANRDVLVWPKSECEHLKIPMPSSTETILIIPLAQSDRFIGCILAFSASTSTTLGRVKRTLKGVMEAVSRAAYRAVLAQEVQETQYRDKLTGLSNRAALLDTLTESAASEVISLILVDGCNFKDLNERLGRSVADELVKALAEVLGEAARKQDVIYRTSAAQFALLMRDTDQGTAQRIAERVLEGVATRKHWPGHLAAWNASWAVAHSTEYGGAAKLLETADDVMLYIRENKFDGRILSASQVPQSWVFRPKKNPPLYGSY
jgi:diguanylate cyclase (GGDEF)-like protein